jgi:hypothetical protein
MRQNLGPDIYKQMVTPYLTEDLDEARIQLRAMETGGHLRRDELLQKISNFAVNEIGIEQKKSSFYRYPCPLQQYATEFVRVSNTNYWSGFYRGHAYVPCSF